ncbi:hypothetical protein SUNI508_12684 [Seiridium unicorne]|uniref:Uncharacterized protein n=1 Tax=Seiridium unicorne TaxID=138068 RepID=A0ABR2VGD6_9PEZI
MSHDRQNPQNPNLGDGTKLRASSGEVSYRGELSFMVSSGSYIQGLGIDGDIRVLNKDYKVIDARGLCPAQIYELLDAGPPYDRNERSRIFQGPMDGR